MTQALPNPFMTSPLPAPVGIDLHVRVLGRIDGPS
jgi:hypothetical protein